MKNLNINFIINNNAVVGIINIVNDVKERRSYDLSRGCGLVYCAIPTAQRWDTQDCFNDPKRKQDESDDYQCQYDYACGYID